MISVDGYRLAMRKEIVVAMGDKDFSFIAPGVALQDLEKMCGDADEPVTIVLGAKNISFAVGSYVLITRRLEGEFLDYKKAIPTDYTYHIKFKRSEMLRAVDRVSLIIDDRIKNPLRCVFGDGQVNMYCVTGGRGHLPVFRQRRRP